MTFNIKDFWLIVLVVCAILHLSNSRLSMEWSIKIKMDQVNGDMDQIAHKIGQEIGLETKGQIGALLGHYLFEIKNNSNHEAIETILSQHSLIEWHKKEKHLHRVKKRPLQKVESVSHAQQNLVNFKDPLFSRQWHLRNGIFGNKDCNVIDVWMNDITGRGVVIAIVDDGVEWHHPDLSDNYCPEGSIDLNDNDRDPTPSLDQSEQNMHGTRCAGEVAAVPNSVCGVGIAFGSKFSAIKLLDGPTTDAMEATAFTKYLDINDIYSCSWGPEDDGKSIDGPHKHGDLALKHGVIAGRNGFGSIYVVASGNGGDKHDNCNFDGYASSIYTITIGAIDEAGQIPPYSEECTSMFACTVSSGKYPSRRIVTTDWSLPDANSEDQCTDDHSGTSAATPLASGMIALMLEVRPCMTWRDIQHIITMTAMDVNHSTAWTNNQAGFRHSNFHGFGLLDSWKLVNAAKIWRSKVFYFSIILMMVFWAPYKELWSAVRNAVVHHHDSIYLKSMIKKHRTDFFNLLCNPVKNSGHRSKVKEANLSGIKLKEDGSVQKLSMEFIDEALIVSDLFNLNEFSAVELLLEGERLMSHYPDLTRGLVAVLLYWDGRKCLTAALKTLIQCRKGQTWSLEVSEEVADAATILTDELLGHGLIDQILKLLTDIDVSAEMDSLMKQRGLGGPRHRTQVNDLISGVRQDLAECLFNFSAQSHLSGQNTVAIIKYMKRIVLTSNGSLSPVDITLLHAVFYAYALPQEIFVRQDGEGFDSLQQYRIFNEKAFIAKVHELMMMKEEWSVPGIKACLQLSWAVTLRSLAGIPVVMIETLHDTSICKFTDTVEQDEVVLELALSGKAFHFLKESVLSCHEFKSNEFFVRRIHGIISDLIVNMPLKIKEMRNYGDEVARILLLHMMQHEQPPFLREDFKDLLEVITALYENDFNDLQLSVEYWCSGSDGFQTGSNTERLPQLHTQRQVMLFKFIQQSGDSLPPLLYIPYLKMLTALSDGERSSRLAFEMLRCNGCKSDGNSISWDHFFASISRYYCNLKHEQSYHGLSNPASSSMTICKKTSSQMSRHQMSITPQEVEGLRSFLKLLATIMQHDDAACYSVYEHPNWNAYNGLLGLLHCDVPPVLKGDILLALEQLARKTEISLGLVQDLEKFVDSGSERSFGQSAFVSILEDVEAREEHFHMTNSFLKLAASLLVVHDVNNVQGLVQVPDYMPYLHLMIDHIFFKFMSRSYKQSEEKYEIAASILKVFVKMVEMYHPHPEHFIAEISPKGTDKSRFLEPQETLTSNSMQYGLLSAQQYRRPLGASKPPGYHLLLHILIEGKFFKTVMEVVENCILYLDQYNNNSGSNKILEAGLLALQLILETINVQDEFLASMRESNNPVLLNTIDKLLLSINPATGKADYIITIMKYVCHSAAFPDQAVTATDIISRLCRTSNSTQREIFFVLTSLSDEETRMRILHGFVEAIESPLEKMDENATKELNTSQRLSCHCQQEILHLLLYCVELPSPNLCHFFLGFNLTHPINKSSLQDAGVMNSPRTCLHSIMVILFSGLKVRNTCSSYMPTVLVEPLLTQLCYELIFKLSANVETSGPLLRYLRSSHDFVYKHLQHLPFKHADIAQESELVLQQAWLLRTASIEMYSISLNRQRSHIERLIHILFEKQTSAEPSVCGKSTLLNTAESSGEFSCNFLPHNGGISDTYSSVSSASATFNSTVNRPTNFGEGVPLIVRILEELDFLQRYPDPIILSEFDVEDIEGALKYCEKTDSSGLVFCDLKTLNKLLQANIIALQGCDNVERRARANQDVQNIMKTALKRNETLLSVHSKLSLLNAWGQILEVSLNASLIDMAGNDTKQQVLLDIFQELLCRVLHEDALPDLTTPASSICLTLMTHLRNHFSYKYSGSSKRLTFSMPSKVLTTDQSLPNVNQEFGTACIPPDVASSLQVIVKDIVEWLQKSGVTQNLRANLYAALLHYIRMFQKSKGNLIRKGNSLASCSLKFPSTDIYSKLSQDFVKLIRNYGNALMIIICEDACEGHSISRILAYSLLDAIVQIDQEQTWLRFMITKGYIGTIASSFVQEDYLLQQALSANATTIKSLHIYEQKMAFLCSLSKTKDGARAVLDAGVFLKLSQCSFLEMRPAFQDSPDPSFPNLIFCYRQLLFPVLNLCMSVLGTFAGRSHFESSVQVMELMLSHSDSIINPVLKLRPIAGDIYSLLELKLVTGILCNIAVVNFRTEALTSTIPQSVLIELQGHQTRIQRHLLGLVPQYCASDQWLQELIRSNQDSQGHSVTQEMTLLIHDISCYLLKYCTTTLLKGQKDDRAPVLIFTLTVDVGNVSDIVSGQGQLGLMQQPTIGFLIQLLKTTISKFNTAMDLLSLHKQKIKNISKLTIQELKTITGAKDDKISIPHHQAVAVITLKNNIQFQEKLLTKLHFMIETNLLLFWHHLNFFFLQEKSFKDVTGEILFQNRLQVTKNSLQKPLGNADSSWGYRSSGIGSLLPRQDSLRGQAVNELKKVISSYLDDDFFNKLCNINDGDGALSVFVKPLVRRIQRIVRLHAS